MPKIEAASSLSGLPANGSGLGKPTNNTTKMCCVGQSLVSGHGKWHTANPARKNPKPYGVITWGEVLQMAQNPPTVDKSQAQWMIPSTTGGEQAREHKFQRENGNYLALWADLDKLEGLFQGVVECVRTAIPGVWVLVYTTRGATLGNPKSRVLIPLADPIQGVDYSIIAKILNDKLEAAGLTPDRANERPGQLCYLPNKGEYYQWAIIDGDALNPLEAWDHEIGVALVEKMEADQKKKERHEQTLLKIKSRVPNGSDPIETFRETYTVEQALENYGYLEMSKGRYLSPNSESGDPAVTTRGQKWHSYHESDAGIGQKSENGGTFGDAFDLWVYYENDGDFHKARERAMVIFAGPPVLPVGASSVPLELAATEPEPEMDFDITNFSMVGRSTEMTLKMLDDKYVLGRLALLGQSTIIYSPPNTGKTLLVICLLIVAIKSGEIKGGDIIYINADDTYKGLVYKLKIAERHGFHMLAPGHAGVNGGPVFKSEDLALYLSKMVQNQTAAGKILILDTAKKFADLMSKTKSSEFAEIIRQFVSHGGTVIMLAHVNKNRDENKKVIYTGTADLVDDADCAFTLDKVQDGADGMRTVKFENFKCRGDVVLEAFYKYNYAQGTSYYDRLDSVILLDDEARQQVEHQKALDVMMKKHQMGVDAIIECITDGVTKKTELIAAASTRSGISKKKIGAMLFDHTGSDKSKNQFWYISVLEKNAHVYHLNCEASDAK